MTGVPLATSRDQPPNAEKPGVATPGFSTASALT